MRCIVRIILSLAIGSIFLKGALSSEAEARLFKRLFVEYSYDKKVRPVDVDSNPVDVTFLLYLRQIIDVEEKLQKIQSRLWLSLEWRDYRLRWNPAEYSNIDRLISRFNSANDNFDPTFKVNVEISSTGALKWEPPGIFTSTCTIDIRFFPFDTQRCNLIFSSWTYDMTRINLTLKANYADIGAYVENGEWELIAAPVVRNEKKYLETYVDATCTIIISRRPLFYLFNLVLPTIFISIIALLTFTLPVESGEKVTLCVTIVLSICVFLLLVMEQLPATSDAVPLLGLYFALSTMLLSVSVVSTIMVLNLHFRTPATNTFPKWVKVWINGYMAFVLRMKRPEPEEDDSLKRRPTVVIHSDLALAREHDCCEDITSCLSEPNDIRWRMRQIVRELRTMTKKMEKDDQDAEICEEWKFAASVIDRFCLWVFGAMIVALTLVTLFAAPRPLDQ